jgi:hypothetical protein
MTKDQAVKNAQTAFVAALDAGVEEDLLIDAVFEATMERQRPIDVAKMANEMFECDTRWLARICEEELRQRELNEAKNNST